MNQEAPPAWRWRVHEAIGSTQDAAMEAAHAGDPGRLAVLAARQTAGRGRSGRAWQSPPGNLHLSVLLRPDDADMQPGRWALLAGLSLYEALLPHAPGLMLKWPNDILLGAGKLGGILIDSHIGPDNAPGWVVIGMGANLAAAPALEGRLAAVLPGPAPSASALAGDILRQLDIWGGRDMAAISEAWLARAHPIGTLLDVHTPQRRIAGRFAGLTARGELLVDGAPGAISSAEIFPQFGPPCG